MPRDVLADPLIRVVLMDEHLDYENNNSSSSRSSSSSSAVLRPLSRSSTAVGTEKLQTANAASAGDEGEMAERGSDVSDRAGTSVHTTAFGSSMATKTTNSNFVND